jgi:pimeloyl-ACP methyl ester carboxylesterase
LLPTAKCIVLASTKIARLQARHERPASGAVLMVSGEEHRAVAIRLWIVQATVLIVLAGWTEVGRIAASENRSERDDSPHGTAAPGAIELREGLAVSLGEHDRRAAISMDPVAAQVVAGRWTMPHAGEAVATSGGQARHWESIKASPDGEFARLGGGYVAFTVSSPVGAVMTLEAKGHAMVTVNGEPRVGDAYASGIAAVPVLLRKGQNEFLFRTSRRQFKARLTVAKAPAFFNPSDLTTPDLIVGEPVDTFAAIVVVNSTESWRDDLVITATLPDGAETNSPVPSLLPLSVRKIGFGLKGAPPHSEGPWTIELKLRKKAPGRQGRDERWETLDTSAITVQIRQPGQTHKRTFRSAIDGSIQYYAVVPALKNAADSKVIRPGLVLTLHGAGVEAIGQANAYTPKVGLHIVAPTNRRPYGFDWEDWGRLDAIEVLDLAQRALGTDPRRTYLTGHSMGGHGTWHLGVNFPDRFAAIAPSAGWVSMWSYAGARRVESQDPVDRLLARAAAPSDTLALVRNTSRVGVYVLHGDDDDNVPVGQARQMRKALGEFHPDFAYHEQPGAGHWWGPACVDWPPLFGFLQEHTLPATATVRKVDFVTASPSVSARAHWVTIEEQTQPFTPSSVHLAFDVQRLRFRGTTENIGRLTLDAGRALGDLKPEGPLTVELDGKTIANLSDAASSSGERLIWLARSGGTWSALRSAAPPARKSPSRQGPFKEAFRNQFVFVIGTKGTPEENAWGLAKARFDAEAFWYRGNGSVDVVPDTIFLDSGGAGEYRDRNVIVYGHSDSNAVWPALLGESPVQVQRGQVRIGRRTLTGEGLACLFVRPRPGSDRSVVGVVAGSGLTGLRLTDRLPYFTSGVAYPDCLVADASKLSEDSSAFIAAGYFGGDWGVDSGEFAWRK